MRLTTDQLRAFVDKIATTGAGQPRTQYLINTYPSDHVHYAMDLPQVPDADMWTEQTVDELARIRETIIEHGWIQGTMITPDGVCLLGGVDLAVTDRRRQDVLRQVLHQFLSEDPAIRWNGGGVATWNDREERTQDEVLDVLNRCTIWVKEKING